jgi:surface protein
VFQFSGYTRTLCGSKWAEMAEDSHLATTGRIGCCPPFTIMAQPNVNPFSTATSCGSCPAGKMANYLSNDDTACRPPYLRDCGYSSWNDRSCGIRQAVDTYQEPDTIAKYGKIQNWDVFLVTDMSRLFQCQQYKSEETSKCKTKFNADISSWNVKSVTDMSYSTCHLYSRRSVLIYVDSFSLPFWTLDLTHVPLILLCLLFAVVHVLCSVSLCRRF